MYQSLMNSIQGVIDHHKKLNLDDHKLTEKEAHYFIQGLEVAKRVIAQTQEINTHVVAYETFEETVKTLSESLDRYDMEEIIEDFFVDED